ncbi:MAG TPA: FAD-dependent oxidoreductase, partial [Candidatus Polarisedimenticolia bacterium]|nr:FAD-dependent oxidoreductase [Candidatus Polarisedimenticolia bacterium]
LAYERAEREDDPERRRAWLTFAVVGGGATGVELAGALAEIGRHSLVRDFRRIDSSQARIVLIEAAPRLLPPFVEMLAAKAKAQLERLGVEVRVATRVTAIDGDGVTLLAGGTETGLAAKTVLWAAGVLASSFGRHVAEALGAETDRAGRIVVGPDLAVPGHPEVIVIGDAAVEPWKPGRPAPGVAQGAIQGGKYAALSLRRRLSGDPERPFRYSDRGDVAVIGRLAGVTNIGWLGPFGRQSGFPAWALWLGIHLVYLIGFSNRIIVLVRWAWSFLTHGRSSRLITGQPLLPDIEEPEPPA